MAKYFWASQQFFGLDQIFLKDWGQKAKLKGGKEFLVHSNIIWTFFGPT